MATGKPAYEPLEHLTRGELIALLREREVMPVFDAQALRDFETSPRPMRIFDRATLQYLAVNDAALRLYGYTREEFLALRLTDTRHPDERAEMLLTVTRPRKIANWSPRRHVTKSGEIIAVETITQDICFAGRQARLSMNIDDTERDQALSLLKKREQEFHSLMAHTPDIVSRLDRGYRHIYVSPAIAAVTGRPPEAFVGKTIDQVDMPPDLAARWRAVLDEAFANGQEQILESAFQGPAGLRHYESRIVPECGMDGVVETMLVITRDFTERRKAEELLWMREQEFESLAENLPDLVARFDRDNRFLYVNSAIERMLRLERADTVGLTPCEVGIPEEVAALYDRSLRKVFESGASDRVEFRLQVGSDERFFEAYHVPEGGVRHRVETVLCVARDITERKRAELAVQRSAALSRLLESLARATNEAITPEAAMVDCLALICRHGNWTLGRVAMYAEGGPAGQPLRSIWHGAEGERFAEFVRISEARVSRRGGSFISHVLYEQRPVWIEDLEAIQGFGRRAMAVCYGLHSAFAFPIIVRGRVVAIMEVFSEERRSRDAMTMGAAQSIASQLARLIEREWGHQANARMAAIVESSQDAILARKLDGTIVTWNPGAEKLLGYTAEEMIGRNIREIVPPELHSRLEARQTLLGKGMAVPGHESVRIAKDGRHVEIATSPAPIRDSSGEVWGISTIVRDITARKRAEEALRTAQRRLAVAIRGGGVGLWEWDVVAGSVYFSPEWKRQLGYKDHELSNRREEWDSRLHPDDRDRVTGVIRQFFGRPGSDYRAEYRLRHRDGSYRWILSRAAAQLGESGNVERMYGCHVDITEQKALETERLERAIRERDALVREVHHRIKNSLQGVIGLLRQKIRRYPAILPGIEEAISQLQSVAVVYGIQSMRPDGTLGLAETLEAICFSAESLTGGRLDIRLRRESPRPARMAGSEAVSVAVALNELVFNALKHQQGDGNLKHACILLHETDDAAEIRIINRGQLPKDFDFGVGRAIGDGLGLVRTLLAAPGGSIRFNRGAEDVEVVLKLGPPFLAGCKPVGKETAG